MPIEIIGYVPHTRRTETSGLWWSDDLDRDYIEETALAHEEAGFDSVLVGQGSWGPDALLIAQHVLTVTKRLKVLVAHRPGFVQPTVAARQFLTLDHLSGGGRLGVHIITGSAGGELQRDGDTLPDDQRYDRTAEYIDLLRKVWSERKPFDHKGRYYQIENGFSSIPPLGNLPLSFAGSSKGALAVGPGRTEYYMIWGEPLAQTAEAMRELHALGTARGLSPKISVSLRAITGQTEDAAWEAAAEIYNRAEAELAQSRAADKQLQVARARIDSVGSAKLDAIAQRGDVQDERLWLGFTRLVGRGGSTTALVGTIPQVTDAFMTYYRAGAQAFYLRGWNIAADARAHGAELIPSLRAAADAADRDTQSN